jgi:hypothetical protein
MLPLVLGGDMVDAWLIDGVLGGVSFNTDGGRNTDAQLEIIRTLSAKYGKPRAQRRDVLENSFGVKVYGYKASWRLPGLVVEFDGATEMYRGYLRISTDRLMAAENAAKREAEKAQRKF